MMKAVVTLRGSLFILKAIMSTLVEVSYFQAACNILSALFKFIVHCGDAVSV